MKYSSFERLVLVLGGASVLATLALTYRTAFLLQEVIAQLLLFGVLVNLAVYLTCGIGGFIVAPIGLVAMDKYYLDHRDAILAAANQAQIPMKA